MITLSDVEQALCRHIAKRRHEMNRANGTVNAKIGPQSNEQTDLDGIGAELAFCKLFNVYPDLQVISRSDHDAMLVNGLRVDVKTTRYQAGRLLVRQHKQADPVDLYVLMVGEFPSFRCAGFASRESVFAPENLMDLGHGPTFVLAQGQLGVSA